ncbi:deoxyhypusine synthase family protein [Candidatus Woesearchaeota archaeon]|nr:deoxyhypusine synthase family protein [Candidatus Woesearchaeota archaeon]
MEKNSRAASELRDGFCDKLTPTVPLDLGKCKTVGDLVKGMSKTAFGGRQLGEAADILYKMVKEKDCFVVLTLSGAMTVAKMGLVVCDMIDNGMVDAVVSTGALMAHGFIESIGMTHFKYDQEMDDKKLYYAGYDRVYDTLELEKNLDEAELILSDVFKKINPDEVVCSYRLCEMIGEHLTKKYGGRGILKSAYDKKVPVFIPAFTDSELGLDFAIDNIKRMRAKEPLMRFDPFLDLNKYAELIKKHETVGIFTIGGGVPRNWAQQVGPYLDIVEKRVGKDFGAFRRFKYAVRICPEPVHWGGLSGCSYSEGVSWGKFVPKSEGGQWAEVFADATIAWPLIVKAVLERLKNDSR